MLSEIDLAYAQTITRPRAASTPCVVLCAMPSAPGLMVRGVLTTALTRARELLILVGTTPPSGRWRPTTAGPGATRASAGGLAHWRAQLTKITGKESTQ